MSVKHLYNKPGALAVLAVSMQFALFFTIVFDIPVARQVIGFLFLTIMPGFAIVRLLKLRLDIVDTFLYSVGASLAFLMISTFFINLLFSSVGYMAPLSLVPLLIVANFMVIVLVVSEWRNSESFALNRTLFFANLRKLVLFGVLLAVPVILTVIGVFFVRIPPHTNNIVLLMMLLTVSALAVSAVLLRRFFPGDFYPFLLTVFAVSLLFHVSLFSNYLQGGDVFSEFYVFRITAASSYWNPVMLGRLSAMLSVTVLPTIYSSVLNLDFTWVFKIVYPLFFVLVPVALYKLYKLRMSAEIAFLSVFFFISNLSFFTELLGIEREMVGELFFVLLFLTLFSDRVKGTAKYLLFALFGFGLIVSHYAVVYIFLGFIAVTFIITSIRKRKHVRITLGLIVLFAILTFAWYIYVSQASTFEDLLGMVSYLRDGFAAEFFVSGSRGGQVMEAVSVTGISTLWHTIGRSTYYIVIGLIIVGFLSMFLKKRGSYFDDDFLVLVFCNLALLGANILIPNFATTFNASRFLHLTLFFLAPLSIFGGVNILKFLSRNRIREKWLVIILALIVFVPFFLFQTNFVYEITREESISAPLSSYRLTALGLTNYGVLTDTEVASGNWLSQHQALYSSIYCDITSSSILVYADAKNFMPLSSGSTIPRQSYVYLRRFNIETGYIFSYYSATPSLNVTQIDPSLVASDLIYSSGSTQVYLVP